MYEHSLSLQVCQNTCLKLNAVLVNEIDYFLNLYSLSRNITMGKRFGNSFVACHKFGTEHIGQSCPITTEDKRALGLLEMSCSAVYGYPGNEHLAAEKLPSDSACSLSKAQKSTENQTNVLPKAVSSLKRSHRKTNLLNYFLDFNVDLESISDFPDSDEERTADITYFDCPSICLKRSRVC